MRRFIRWDAKVQRFFFCHERVSLAGLGAMLVYALHNGKDVLLQFCERDRGRERFRRCSWSVEVKPVYVEQMLRFVHQHGWFWDEVPEFGSRKNSDHDFDPANITPGLNWKLVGDMQQGADLLDKQAHGLDLESQWPEHRRRVKELHAHSAALRQRAADLRQTAADLLKNSVYPIE